MPGENRTVENGTIAVALVALVVGSTVGGAAVALAPGVGSGPAANASDDPGTRLGPPTEPVERGADSASADVERFDSEAEFRRYVRASRSRSTAVVGLAAGGGDVVRSVEPTVRRTAEAAGDGAAPAGGNGGTPDRVSDTNVQEAGVDEPDVLKTMGGTVFYAGLGSRYRGDAGRIADTRVIDASDPASPEVIAGIEATGRMLVAGDSLVVLGEGELTGYDVSDPADPERTWERDLQGRVAAARLFDGEVYLVLREGIRPSDPCPVRPMGDEGPVVECTEVYHPTRGGRADVTYTTVRLDPASGEVTDTVSVVGSAQNAATYVSRESVYVSYVRHASRSDLLLEFLLTNDSVQLDDIARQRLEEVRGYNLSEAAERAEIRHVLQGWFARLSPERREEVRQAYAENWRAFLRSHRRELTTTGIVEIGIDGDLSVEAVGEVPGVPLNQFSMDEHEGRLRVATTVGGVGFRRNSENDVYVLDSNLTRVGSVQGLAPGQRIYSVRFMEETAYVVTFRQIDPFHVIDLSDPADPVELGQVELPGFSRYLHPLGEDRVLGIGQENGQVKAVVFDVSDPTSPEVLDSRIVDDRWSAVQRSHHAFLNDPRHDVFFLPGSRGGYVFSYGEDGLSLTRRVETRGWATRAMYVNDYMYVFGQGGMVVLNESNWEQVDELVFEDARLPPEEDEPR